MSFFKNYLKLGSDVVVTLLLWTYFLFGYILFFSPFYMYAYLFSKNREVSFQALNHFFFKGFFLFVQGLIPGMTLGIKKDVFPIRSSVIVCNHLSYLDPILLISLFKKQRTIVKSVFFNIPIFGRILSISGYIPSDTRGKFSSLFIERMDSMERYLASGGNLFIFPEGTRSRDGRLGEFNNGAFRIAKYCNAPIVILSINNSNRLFPPGRFLFNTFGKNDITVKLIGRIDSGHQPDTRSTRSIVNEVRSVFEK